MQRRIDETISRWRAQRQQRSGSPTDPNPLMEPLGGLRGGGCLLLGGYSVGSRSRSDRPASSIHEHVFLLAPKPAKRLARLNIDEQPTGWCAELLDVVEVRRASLDRRQAGPGIGRSRASKFRDLSDLLSARVSRCSIRMSFTAEPGKIALSAQVAARGKSTVWRFCSWPAL